MGEEKEVKEREGQVIQLSGTAYIRAGAFFGSKKAEAQKVIDAIVEELKKKKLVK